VTDPRDTLPGGGLIITLEGTVVQTVPMGEGVVTIGRLPENRVTLQHASVSRYHAEVKLEGTEGAATVTDVGSSGGTTLGEEQLKPNQPYRLTGGTVFHIGPFDITYVAPSGSGGAARGAAGRKAQSGGRSAKPAPAAVAAAPATVPEGDETVVVFPTRPRLPVPPPPHDRSRYVRFLPGLYHDGDFLGRMLLIFEALWEPLEWRQTHIEQYFDARTCPAPFLPWLARWLGLDLDRHWPEERRRRLLTEAMELYRWRGTPYGLQRMIEVCTGLSATIQEDPQTPFVFRIVVRMPRDSMIRTEMLERLVQLHKPAHVGYVLEVTS
jgi:phage tail-like protein